WHISAQYVNPTGTVAGYKGCLGGNMMDVAPGDNLQMSLVLQGSTWVQTVVRSGVACSGPGSGLASPNGCTVSFSMDMKGQAQPRAELVLELYYQAVVTSDVTFSNIQLQIKNPEPASSTRFCTPTSRLQVGETCSGMVLSADRTSCSIDSCLFKATAAPPAVSVSVSSGTDANGNAIDPGNVVLPPPAEDNSSSDSATASNNSGDAQTTAQVSSNVSGTSQTTSSVVGNQGVSNNQQNTQPNSSSSPNYALYGGIGAGAVVVLVVGGFVISRRRSSSDSDDSPKFKAIEVSNDDFPPPSLQPYQSPPVHYLNPTATQVSSTIVASSVPVHSSSPYSHHSNNVSPHPRSHNTTSPQPHSNTSRHAPEEFSSHTPHHYPHHPQTTPNYHDQYTSEIHASDHHTYSNTSRSPSGTRSPRSGTPSKPVSTHSPRPHFHTTTTDQEPAPVSQRRPRTTTSPTQEPTSGTGRPHTESGTGRDRSGVPRRPRAGDDQEYHAGRGLSTNRFNSDA
ncbi:hypothetical protein HDU99_005381, partial [Rhizoclosmatium hyalinum]